ncbi:MAG: thiamine pyrophosphate-dependent enzyme [Archaeoglobaceae archaeon]|nr:thiamine pyrophosphate-dependent enzyme [Archaeoglobaceae archaeon]MCX8152750.1 thiamine pyrophosphate-dependent enzyme [Archaeoglobaceae archaeon]MDW8013457.1 thiamine pyrophosphate-dependent enzyme [Archaeoglobaceae archaeon]
MKELRTDAWVQWCPGCGNYGILSALQKALIDINRDFSIVGGIGCSSRIVYYLKGSFNVHTLHGRAIPVASGIKLSKPELLVIVSGGDGDILGIGAGHFLALGRRNLDLKVFIHDNAVYGLTKGQAGPTLPLNVKLKAMPYANVHDAINPILLAFVSGYTFIARAYAYHIRELKEIMKEAMKHRGAAVVDILQPCTTYNDLMTREWFEERIYYMDSIPDRSKLFEKMLEKEKIPLGIFFKEEKETFEERLKKAKLYKQS